MRTGKKKWLCSMVLLLAVNVLLQAGNGVDYKRLKAVPQKEEVGALRLTETIKPVRAPFKIPEFKKPNFGTYRVNIQDLGAKPGQKATAIIQQAIDNTSLRGGGTVVVPAGKWMTGRISLKSNVNLYVSEGAELCFSGEVADYLPVVFTRNEGIELMSLGACIYAYKQENIGLTGKGKLIGPARGGSIFKQVMDTTVIENFVALDKPVTERYYDGKNGGAIFLPMFISPTDCKNVYIEGLTLENTAFWNIVPVYCDHVIIRGMTVNSVGIPRGDGIDIESTKNVLIEYCTLNNGDDCFTLKAGRGEDGLRVNIPSENIVIRHCLAQKGHGAITVGSETAAMIRNVYVHDCVFDNTESGLRFKTRRPRGGGGENLTYERIRMNLNGSAFNWDMLGSSVHVGDLANRMPLRPVDALTPLYRNIVARDIIVEKSTNFVKAYAIPESPLQNVTIENVLVNAGKLMIASDVNNFVIKRAVIDAAEQSADLTNVKNMLFEDVVFKGKNGQPRLNVTESNPGDVRFVNCKPTGATVR